LPGFTIGMRKTEMRYLSCCSGIEAATVAWHSLGWEPVGFSEIDRFPCALLKHHYPNVPNYGNLLTHNEWPLLRPDLVVAGTPCQAFSIAGLREGLADPRGNLTLVFLGVLARQKPEWVVWENVPGVLSDKTGAFQSFLRGLDELGYGVAWRVLDAQYFGVPQRRRRVFVVARLGDVRGPAEVLFEPEGLRGNSAESGETGESAPAPTGSGAEVWPPVAMAVMAVMARDAKGPRNFQDGGLQNAVAFNNVNGEWSPTRVEGMRESSLVPAVFPTVDANIDRKWGSDQWVNNKAHALQETASRENPDSGPRGKGWKEEEAFTLDTRPQNVSNGWRVRRITPTECERLQGFPDGYTQLGGTKDGPRYKALGNSMAVPVMHWIGKRICSVN